MSLLVFLRLLLTEHVIKLALLLLLLLIDVLNLLFDTFHDFVQALLHLTLLRGVSRLGLNDSLEQLIEAFAERGLGLVDGFLSGALQSN